MLKKRVNVISLRVAFIASIDWHDFVVVDIVEFTEADEKIPLPPPISIADLESLTLEQKQSSSFFPTQKDSPLVFQTFTCVGKRCIYG